MMKFLFLTITVLIAIPVCAQDLVQPACVSLEKSGFLNSHYRSEVAISNDQQLIARFEEAKSQKEGFFNLWDAKTGKLLQSKKLYNLAETGSHSSLRFSPSSNLVYLNDLKLKGKTKIIDQSTVAFWNLSSNKIVLSSCGTCNSIGNHHTEIKLNTDETVAYVTNHHGHSLCSTTEEKLLACGNPSSDDPQTKQLFDAFLKQKTLPQKELVSEEAAIHSIPGGYENDLKYRKHGAYKFDQFFLFRSKNVHTNKDNNKLFILNWKTGEGNLLKVDGDLMDDFSPHWMPKRKQLIVGFTDYSGTPVESVSTYHVEQKVLKRLSGHDEVLFIKRMENGAGTQGVNFISLSKQKQQMRYCQLWGKT